jgi:hypothetical protein
MSAEPAGWQTGHMQTSDSRGEGFAQQHAEMRAHAAAREMGRLARVLVVFTGALPDPNHEGDRCHRAHPGEDAGTTARCIFGRRRLPVQVQHWQKGEYNRPALADGGWHTGRSHAGSIIIYFDGLEQKRIQTLPEYRVPRHAVSLQGCPSRQMPQ